MSINVEKLNGHLISVASELFRFQRVFDKAVSKLDLEEQSRYQSQFAWFSKKVGKALEEANISVVNLEGQIYDPGMAVVPLNIDDFDASDELYISQMIEPIVMQDDSISKMGTVILGRVTE